MNQTERLKNYLDNHETINPLQAWNALGIYRLGARIFDLKAMGINITKQMVEVKNQFGESCHVACYRKIDERKVDV